MILYHGGAPGFRPGDLIQPHETKHLDGCAICQAAADENHLPDQVFATTLRIYGKHHASKWGRGWLYIVEPEGDLVRSDADPFETYHAPAFRVVSVSERGVELTMSERRRLYRLWKADDRARGRGNFPGAWAMDRALRALLGISP